MMGNLESVKDLPEILVRLASFEVNALLSRISYKFSSSYN